MSLQACGLETYNYSSEVATWRCLLKPQIIFLNIQNFKKIISQNTFLTGFDSFQWLLNTS